jgi:hypothetical protein
MDTSASQRSSVAEDVRDLFAEYADAYVRGDEPQARDFLARAGDDADELGRMLEAFLAAAPRQSPGPDALAIVGAWAEREPPLVHVRASRGVRVDEVVDAIVENTGIAAEKRPKVKRYYQQLEQGLLDPGGVSERVWEVVRRLIGPLADASVGWASSTAIPDTAFFRAAAPLARGRSSDAEPATPPERDEVDDLFTNAG